jgi:hypothetical protein
MRSRHLIVAVTAALTAGCGAQAASLHPNAATLDTSATASSVTTTVVATTVGPTATTTFVTLPDVDSHVYASDAPFPASAFIGTQQFTIANGQARISVWVGVSGSAVTPAGAHSPVGMVEMEQISGPTIRLPGSIEVPACGGPLRVHGATVPDIHHVQFDCEMVPKSFIVDMTSGAVAAAG